jgi:hypothetical protein
MRAAAYIIVFAMGQLSLAAPRKVVRGKSFYRIEFTPNANMLDN